MESLVAVITTGGTIASRHDPGGTARRPTDDPEILLRSMGRRATIPVELQQYKNVLGTALLPADLMAVAQMARRALARPEVKGVVVTAGTGIIEEGSYLCDLLNDSGKPIVWTGAQRGADDQDADGPRNLADAIAVASSDEARQAGARALVCFNEEVFAARDVVKHHKTNVAAFSSSEGGPLAGVDPGGMAWFRRSWSRPAIEVERFTCDVDLVKLVSGSDDRFFRASIAAGARGIVVEAFPGTGVVSPGARAGIDAALAAGLTVLLSARSPGGRALPLYGTELGAAELVPRGVILGGSLAPAKLRLLLMAVLSMGGTPARVPLIIQQML
jgi:L-asparaginase